MVCFRPFLSDIGQIYTSSVHFFQVLMLQIFRTGLKLEYSYIVLL
jgi:hypothetical protein